MKVWFLLSGALVVAALGCHDEERRYRPPAPLLSRASASAATTLDRAALGAAYQRNAWAVSEGKRLFNWYNCSGCHAQGGGGMGPALMDAAWRYGSSPDQVFTSITRGRPNGMPAFGARLSEAQAWQLAAYVRSMSGLLPVDVRPGRSDALTGSEPEVLQEPQPRTREAASR